ncbi:hypothetical protein EYC80_005790 [Monilinia laxa]|uniref:Uncharacterized protein n=1 Tax=Monilinia laxa TaxID=61186 RepID=A0A5N6KFJ6_MONLA|nr:hypothetical protein EYC80_005790 [Monilinia laxa]
MSKLIENSFPSTMQCYENNTLCSFPPFFFSSVNNVKNRTPENLKTLPNAFAMVRYIIIAHRNLCLEFDITRSKINQPCPNKAAENPFVFSIKRNSSQAQGHVM